MKVFFPPSSSFCFLLVQLRVLVSFFLYWFKSYVFHFCLLEVTLKIFSMHN